MSNVGDLSASLPGPTESFAGGDGPIGVVLCHGFTGSPASMRPWAEYLLGAGYRVSVPLLPGHGTSVADMNATTWHQWYEALNDAVDQMTKRCDRVFLAGLSMGGALTLRLAANRPTDIAGVVLVNPAIALKNPALKLVPLLSRWIGSIKGISNDIAKPGADEMGYDRTPLRALASQLELWSQVRRDLELVTAPILLYRSRNDHVVDETSLGLIIENVSSTVIRTVELLQSYHVATLDHDAETIFSGSVAFIEEMATP